MKTKRNFLNMFERPMALGISLLLTLFVSVPAIGQDDEEKKSSGPELARPAFESVWIIDQQTVIVPTAKTLEFDFQHRFGTVQNGVSDFFGIYAPGANVRLGLNYTPMEKLSVGIGFAKYKKYVDANAKYAIFQQTKEKGMPVSMSVFGNVAMDTRSDIEGSYTGATDIHRLSYYGELIIARRINSKISVQISPSFTHYNAVDSVYAGSTVTMKNDMIGLGVAARYKFSAQSSLQISYVQPFGSSSTMPKPGLAIGWEISTSAHAFQFFVSNYQGILPQENMMYNPLDFGKGEVLIGFNITRLWNF